MVAPLQQTNTSETVSRERFNREKEARLEAERMLEARSRELYEANRSLSASLEKEQKLVALQYALITSINHEFRTPLTVVDGATTRIEKIATGESREGVLEKCSQIKRAVHNLTQLIERSLQGFGDDRGDTIMPIDVQSLTRQPMSDR
ncbi:hypothetical protein [Ponticaulis sp.]|uniref:hypothetical protein n=1 Tax=Ponticaulis sp. TaxID=2020902 RepID=UPI000B751711|nr:hypothetical protein [Ponticaulis sp.]MAI88891.1 hypothetical protein [Ponticaulis sp.]OUY01582.1 MAG: hypothetical protein CBB65_00230 [Hyphomonadaceae bacterium TMED5]|tara:strand:- start:13312 stop:13755 length:444 start_codon:yes stop_codon:yes gene_type:complete